MEVAASSTDQLFAELARFRGVWPKRGWSWDYRLNCVASSFHVDLTRDCESALLGSFADVYDQRSLDRASDNIIEMAEAAGGIRPDQRIYVMRSTGRLMPYALWWPWGDEITVSLRVGLSGYVGDPDFQRLQLEFNSLS
jgi:hypothetical protein